MKEGECFCDGMSDCVGEVGDGDDRGCCFEEVVWKKFEREEES